MVDDVDGGGGLVCLLLLTRHLSQLSLVCVDRESGVHVGKSFPVDVSHVSFTCLVWSQNSHLIYRCIRIYLTHRPDT